MLKGPVLHPQLLALAAAAGHGSTVLVADGNFPHSTGSGGAPVVHLNLRPGLVSAPDALGALLDLLPFEDAAVMIPPPDGPDGRSGTPPALPVHAEFATLLRPLAPRPLGRHEFYAAVRTPDLAFVVATGETRTYANVLLTVGVRAPASGA